MKTWVILIVFACQFSIVVGQSSRTARDSARVGSMLNLGIQYRSDYFYMGRSDSSRVPYLTPSLIYFHKSGFSLSSGFSYLASGDGRIDLYTFGAGYDYFGKKLVAGISYSQYLFDNSSYSVQAEMKTYLSTYFGYDFDYLMLIADASMGVSKDLDFFLGAELSRSFYFLRDRLRVTPAVYMNLGTQYYYNEYYRERSIGTGSGSESGNGSGGFGNGGSGDGGSGGSSSRNGKSKTSRASRTSAGSRGSIITITTVEIAESGKFQVLDYEVSLQTSYRLKAFRFVATATVLFPVNPSIVITDKSVYEEELKTGFLWSGGVRYTIR